MGYLVTRAERLADSGAPAEAIRTAWRHVLDIEPDHRDALRRLLEIADSDLERLEIHRKLADGYSHGSPPWQVHLQKAIELADGARASHFSRRSVVLTPPRVRLTSSSPRYCSKPVRLTPLSSGTKTAMFVLR